MGFFDWLEDIYDSVKEKVSDAYDAVKEKVSDAIDWVTDKLDSLIYNRDKVNDQINVDSILSEQREMIQDEVNQLEMERMDIIPLTFGSLKEMTRDRFPDLIDIIDEKQKMAEDDLKGNIIQYVKEHQSKNNMQYRKILEMSPGPEKRDALRSEAQKIMNDAVANFNNKLAEYVEGVQTEFSARLKTRLDDQENLFNEYIAKLEVMEDEAKNGTLNVDQVINDCAPIMETAQCIFTIVENG